MSVLETIARIFGRNETEVEGDGLALLQQYLRQQEQVLSLEVTYGRPDISGTADGSVEPLAVFPMRLNDNGVDRGDDALVFPIPDDGLQDPDAPLTQFCQAHGISTVEDLGAIEGQVDSATVTERGTVEVDY